MDQHRAVPSARSHVPLSEQLGRRASALLEAGVPLSLLIDLSNPAGPRSREVYATEYADTDWVPVVHQRA
jgi:hypothetical protein